jgi:penicillin-binding protein 1C
MKNIGRSLGKIRNYPWQYQVFCLILLLLIIGRSLPYFIPITSEDLQQKQQAFIFRDRYGLPLGSILTRDQENTAVVELKQVSPLFLQAIIATEDQRFYQHGAVDLRAIARAILEAIQAKRIVSGGSTITMQLARMINPAPRTLSQKLQEIWQSWRIFAGMNRQEILQAYINRLPMGGNIYGVEAASRIYFGVSAQDLNLAQASLLAAIPNDPNGLNPYEYWDNLKRRQEYVLNRMVVNGYIGRSQVEKAMQEKVSLQPRDQGIIAAPHFLFLLAENLNFHDQAHQLLAQTNSLEINTTIDRNLQKFVEGQVKQTVKNLEADNVHQAATVVIKNDTAEILAYVGSADYFDQKNQGNNDGVQALRQPGSTLKPFLYQLALEKGVIASNSILEDSPAYYAIPGAKIYQPTNYNADQYMGPIPVRLALANSLNIPAVKVLEKVGVEKFLQRLRHLGFHHLNKPAEYYGLGLTLGSGEVTLWELANSYLTMANQGKIQPFHVTTKPHIKLQDFSLQNRDNSINNSIGNLDSLPMDKKTWLLITDMLNDSHARASEFGVDSVLNLPFPAAVKTGTSSDFRDTWTVGFTQDYTVATWVGNFNGDRLKLISGVMGAAPLWANIMLHLHEKKPPVAFDLPPNFVKKPICTNTGLKPTKNCQTVINEYLDRDSLVKYNHTNNYQINDYPKNHSKSQDNTQSQLPESDPLQIISPQNDDYFLISPHQTNQLALKINNPSQAKVEWLLNGKKITSQTTDTFFWSMQPGEWLLEVRSTGGRSHVKFTVAITNQDTLPKGFSVGK